MSTLKRLITNTAVLTIGDGIGQALLFFSTIVIARLLSPEDFGDFGIIRSTILLSIAMTGMRMEMTGNKYVAEFYQRDLCKCARIISVILIITLISTTIVLGLIPLISNWIAVSIYNKPYLADYLVIASLVIFFATNRSTLTGILNGFERFKYGAYASVVSSMVGVGMIILLTWSYGVIGALWGYVIHRSLYMCVSLYFVLSTLKSSKIQLVFSGLSHELKEVMGFMIPGYIIALSVLPLRWISEAFLIRTQNGSYEMALVTIALTFQVIALFPITKLQAPLISVLSSNKREHVELNSLNINASFWLACPFFIITILWPDLVGYVFGEEYQSTRLNYLIIIISLSTLVGIMSKGVERVMIVSNKMWKQVVAYSIHGLVIVAFSFFFVDSYKSIGLLIAYFFGSLTLTTMLIAYSIIQNDVNNRDIVNMKNLIQLLLVVVSVGLSIYFIELLLVRLITLAIVLLTLAILHKNLFGYLIQRGIKPTNVKNDNL